MSQRMLRLAVVYALIAVVVAGWASLLSKLGG
jgi:hypothetical protein